MINSIFFIKKLEKGKINKAKELKANAIFIGHKNLEKSLIKDLREKGIKIYTEIGIFTDNLCPNNEEIRRKKLTEIRNLVNNFQIDGIWLDFIRFPLFWEIKKPQIEKSHTCFLCERVMNRTEVIKSFVSEIDFLINQNGRNIQLGMFAVPWREKDFGGAITRVMGQDFRSLSKYIDVFSPMVYHQMCGRTTSWIHEVVSYLDKVTNKTILPIIQTEDKPKKISKNEFKEEIKEAIKHPSQGVIIFFLEDLLVDKDKMAVVEEMFKAD